MANGLKSESEWDAGSLILSRESTGVADGTSVASTSSASTARLPELPKIHGEVLLELNTHRLLRSEGANAFKDNERLSEVGEMALNLAVTNYLYHKQPTVEAIGMPAERCIILSTENYEKWTNHYALQKQLRYDQKQNVDLNSPQEIRTLFNAYVGAVYEEHGMRAVGTWISRLIDPDYLPVNPDDTTPTSLPPQKDVFRQRKQSNHREVKRQKSEVLGTPAPESYSNNGVIPTPPNTTPPPMPAPIYAPGQGVYSSPAVNYYTLQPSLATYGPVLPSSQLKEVHYLPKFNEKCSQQKLPFEYTAENHGSPHDPRWIVKCMVKGVHKGTGQGSSKQVAKEAAAKQAFLNMGWFL
ncbi:hypothetical protein SCHPADRAFT_934565 [Schizopora paradoxa]|uniref:Uncharacterized protein n=1 Tax=Schizopora paradoxa TaxID=27342 RepID=A0A0H2SUD4_9AGAM|nr:hypothetical protein SCHPADRAFT_934565 [Schizopora paradoxa]